MIGGRKNPRNLSFAEMFRSRVFQPGFRGTSGFLEWLPGFPPKQTEVAWDKVGNHSSMRLQQHRHLYRCRVTWATQTFAEISAAAKRL